MTQSHDLDEIAAHLDPTQAPQRCTRRHFVGASIGTGIAAAAWPAVADQMIRTDDRGLQAGPVTVPVGSFGMPAYAAKPAGKSGCPVLLVVSEIFGVHAYIADVTRRFAKLGYHAIAPELFVRQGDARSYPDVPTLVRELIAKVPDDQVMGDLDATVAWAGKQGADTGKLGITGFCWGGRIAWLYDAHNPAVKAAVAWYGRLVGSDSELTPKHPIDVAERLNGPVLGLYGAEDAGIPLDTIENMKNALATGSSAAKASEFVIYPEAGHAFHADYRPSYMKDAAMDGWQRSLAWFKAHGVA